MWNKTKRKTYTEKGRNITKCEEDTQYWKEKKYLHRQQEQQKKAMGLKSNSFKYTMTTCKRNTFLWKAEGKRQRQSTTIKVWGEINHPSPSMPCLIMETNTPFPPSPFLSVYFYITENMKSTQYPIPLGYMLHPGWWHHRHHIAL